MPDAMLVLDQMANLHASSSRFLRDYGGGVDKFASDFPFYAHDEWLPPGDWCDMLRKRQEELWEAIRAIVVESAGDEDGDEAMVGRVKALGDNGERFVERLRAASKPKWGDGGFCCLVHGDPWCNNFMFE